MPSPVTRVNKEAGEMIHLYPQFLPGGKQFLYFIRHGEAEKMGIYMGSLDGKPGTPATRNGNGCSQHRCLCFSLCPTAIGPIDDHGRLHIATGHEGTGQEGAGEAVHRHEGRGAEDGGEAAGAQEGRLPIEPLSPRSLSPTGGATPRSPPVTRRASCGGSGRPGAHPRSRTRCRRR
jgi:hypothetical protein